MVETIMNKGSLKVRKAKENLVQLNRMFHELDVAPIEFYQQLKSRNVDVGLSILISVCPDGDNTYFGSLINQLGSVCSFDIDCDDEKYSRWDVGSPIESSDSLQHANAKPWDAKVIAAEMFSEMAKNIGLQ